MVGEWWRRSDWKNIGICTKDGDEVEWGIELSRYMSYRSVFAGYSSIGRVWF